MVKENTAVWDATAANRTMYETKDDPRILYTDIEEDLSFKPDAIMDCKHTTFKDKSKHHITFDPPHGWGRMKNSTMFTSPDKKYVNDRWPKWARKGHPRYYGLDKYQDKEDLKAFIDDALKEFHRVLEDDGILMFKWSDRAYPVKELAEQFLQWKIIMKIPIFSAQETAKKGCWLLLMKNIS